jgi:hypothetical protein
MAIHDLPGPIPARPAWMADAACREHPEVDFFPGPRGDAEPAKAVCAGCCREACAAYARENGEVGVWGGRLLKLRQDRPAVRKPDEGALAARTATWRRSALAARAKRGPGEARWLTAGAARRGGRGHTLVTDSP